MRSDELTIRHLTDDELETALDLLAFVFADPITEEGLADERSVQDPSRSQAAFDGDTLVGCLGSFQFDLSVPGGSVACAGTTWVGVAPTHRRRGVLRQLMTAHLHQVHEDGEPVAALWASEVPIYGRYGYGMAIEQLRFDIALDRGLGWAEWAPRAPDQVRTVPLAQAAEQLTPIYEAVRARRGGLHRRSPTWWSHQVLSERPATRAGASFKKVAIARIDGVDAAYAVYGAKERWDEGGRPTGQLFVVEMMGLEPAAEIAMWRYLTGHDLMTSVMASRRPVDDPLPLALTNSRLVRRSITDALFVRIVDLPAAMSARSYADSAGVTIEVTDPLLRHNDGTWRVEVAPEGAAVQPSQDPPDLEMGISVLGALYLGGISVQRLVAAGLVQVHNPGVLTAFDNALRAGEAPWAAEVW